MDETIETFVEDLNERKGLSKNTIDSYERDIKAYFVYLKEQNIDFKAVRRTNIITYISFLQHNGRATSSISRTIASIRALYHMLIRNHIIVGDPTIDIETPKIQKKIPDILTIEEMKKLLSIPDANSGKGVRDVAILEVLYATGMKTSELILLDLSDIDLDLDFIRCRNVKERIIPIGSAAEKALENYVMNYREKLLKNVNEKALFLNLRGDRMTRQGLWKIIKSYANLACIEKDITPHTIRNSFAVHMIQNGADLKSVQEMLGHSDISTTQIYLSTIKTKIDDVYKKTHPRAFITEKCKI